MLVSDVAVRSGGSGVELLGVLSLDHSDVLASSGALVGAGVGEPVPPQAVAATIASYAARAIKTMRLGFAIETPYLPPLVAGGLGRPCRVRADAGFRASEGATWASGYTLTGHCQERGIVVGWSE